MAGTQKTSQFTAATVANPTDEVPLLQSGVLKRVQVKTLVGNPDVGWLATGESWSYSSYNSTTRVGVVTAPSDATTKYNKDMKVRFSQTTGGTKYARIKSVTSTTITLFMLNSSTLTNESITTPVYSPLYAPVAPGIDWMEQEPWIAPTLLNSWVNHSVTYEDAKYFKDTDGMVHLKGLIKLGTVSASSTGNAFVLPSGYRPSGQRVFTGLSGAATPSRVDVFNDGSVRIMTGNNDYVTLDTIRFRAEA